MVGWSGLTEREVEDRLSLDHNLIEPGLTLVARQSRIEPGEPDLVGVDRDGRVVVIELKVVQAIRESIAQLLDYLTYVDDIGLSAIEQIVRTSEKSDGIEQISDILAWYVERFPVRAPIQMLPPRAILATYGSDPDAVRIVRSLRRYGVPIELSDIQSFSGPAGGGRSTRSMGQPVSLPAPRRSTRTGKPKTHGPNEDQLEQHKEFYGVTPLFNRVHEVADSELERLHSITYPIGIWYVRRLGRKRPNVTGIEVLRDRPGSVGIPVFHDAANLIGSSRLDALTAGLPQIAPYREDMHSLFVVDSFKDWERDAKQFTALVSAINSAAS